MHLNKTHLPHIHPHTEITGTPLWILTLCTANVPSSLNFIFSVRNAGFNSATRMHSCAHMRLVALGFSFLVGLSGHWSFKQINFLKDFDGSNLLLCFQMSMEIHAPPPPHPQLLKTSLKIHILPSMWFKIYEISHQER